MFLALLSLAVLYVIKLHGPKLPWAAVTLILMALAAVGVEALGADIDHISGFAVGDLFFGSTELFVDKRKTDPKDGGALKI